MKRKEPLKLMPLDDLKKILAEIVSVPKETVERAKPKPKGKKAKR